MENQTKNRQFVFSLPILVIGFSSCLVLGSLLGGSFVFSQVSGSSFSRLVGVWPAGAVEEFQEC